MRDCHAHHASRARGGRAGACAPAPRSGTRTRTRRDRLRALMEGPAHADREVPAPRRSSPPMPVSIDRSAMARRHGAGGMTSHLLEQVPVPLAVVGTDGAFRAANAGFARLVGFDANGLAGRDVAEVLRPADGQGDVSLDEVATGEGTAAAHADLPRVRRFHRRPTGSFWGRLGVRALDGATSTAFGDT